MKMHPSNREIADVLQRIAALLEAQDANPYRIRAYRSAAERVAGMQTPLADIIRQGDGDALQALPDIGEGIARTILDFVRMGRSEVLDRLRGETAPTDLFAQVPGIGERLAARIARQLGVHSLEDLERAAHDGRLAQVEGFGETRVRNVRVSLAGMLSRTAQRDVRQRAASEQDESPAPGRPAVETLLAVDKDYRQKAAAGALHQIAPRRFNPERKAWLPILHTHRDGWNFRVLYSNTARAHELEKTHDWVVVYYDRDGVEGQATVVTATQGPLEGKRVVRGREAESARLWAHRRDLPES
ncbi:MAG: helix-hairpin-helix domain-containing protein [Chloroflexota bacterium]